ncbi:MAG: acyl-CoA/acyl-ACP dehydrogenase [Desulfomonile tiedjei]|nr:acyl-CoA/acyl-ACP dehydrogenase [Desulfomonile tiedjei]
MTYLDLNIELTDEQNALKEQAHKFAGEILRPASIELDKIADPEDMIKSPVFKDTMRKGFELGYHNVLMTDTYGGLGLDPLEVHMVLEEMGWGSADFAIGIGVSCFPAFFACMLPNDLLEETIISPFCQNRDATIIGCWAITEPNHGNDQLCPGTELFRDPKIKGQLRAKLEGDEWVINGQKSAWVSNGPIATHALAYLNIDPSMGLAGGGICIIPLDRPGVSRGRALNKLGQRALSQGEIYFDDVRVPRDFMLVDQESYEAMLDVTLSTANAAMGAVFTGTARAAYEEALAYSKERIQGGKPLFEHQIIKHKLFNMFMKVEAARALSRAALVYNYNNTPPSIEYSIASKVFCTNTAFEVANEAVQIFGGYGMSKEYAIEKIFRDARAALIEDGANDSLMITGAHKL